MPLQFAFALWNCFLFWNWHPWATIVVNFFLIVDQILWRVKEASFQRKTCILCPWQLYCVALFYLQIGNCIWKLWVSCVLLITFFNFFFWLFFCIQKHILRWKNLSNIQHRFSQLVVWYVPENVQNINYLYTARGSLHKVKQRDIWYTKIYVHIIGPPGLPNKWSISLFNSNELRGIKGKRPNTRWYDIIHVI